MRTIIFLRDIGYNALCRFFEPRRLVRISLEVNDWPELKHLHAEFFSLILFPSKRILSFRKKLWLQEIFLWSRPVWYQSPEIKTRSQQCCFNSVLWLSASVKRGDQLKLFIQIILENFWNIRRKLGNSYFYWKFRIFLYFLHPPAWVFFSSRSHT